MMGGGGGGYSINSSDVEALKREVEERTKRSLADAEINDFLSELLTQINFRDTEKTSEYLDRIADALSDDIADFDRLLFGGSVAKHTYVDGLSDIDSLVVLDTGAADVSPAELRQRLFDALQAKLPKGDIREITVGQMAVTLNYRDGTEIQLLAARERGEVTEISSADGQSWQSIEPKSFAKALTAVNQQQGGAVVPTIKLAKGVIDTLPKEARLSGYHVEALALAAFTSYTDAKSPRQMLTHFFESAAAAVRRPVNDITGQSRYIDYKMGPVDSSQRMAASAELGRMAARMKSADTPAQWRQILGS